jgi:hypothetical protein
MKRSAVLIALQELTPVPAKLLELISNRSTRRFEEMMEPKWAV